MVTKEHLRSVALAISCVFLAYLVAGCKGKPSQSADDGSESQKTEAAQPAKEENEPQEGKQGEIRQRTLDEAILLWSQGKQAAAAEVFLLIDWQKTPFAEESIFKLTEKEYSSLSPSERAKKDALISPDRNHLRKLCRHILDSGKGAATAGDTDKAQRHFRAVEACGKVFVGNPDALLILKMIGESCVRAASKESRSVR